MSKDGFILYKSQCKTLLKLSELELGSLFKNILEYQINGKIPEFQNTYEEITFNLFKNQFDIDSQKYKDLCQKNIENIKKRWSSNTTVYDRKKTDTTVKSGIPNDNDNDNDNENVDASLFFSGKEISEIENPFKDYPDFDKEAF